eukprot:1272719-Rhodomonas_salina.1
MMFALRLQGVSVQMGLISVILAISATGTLGFSGFAVTGLQRTTRAVLPAQHVLRTPSSLQQMRMGSRPPLPFGAVEWLKDLALAPGAILHRPRGFDPNVAMQSEKHLIEWLERRAGVDVSVWGEGKAKRPFDLYKELHEGESCLSSEGVRIVKVAKVRIMDGDHELIEVRQHLRNGAVKHRNRLLAEKFKPGENPIAAAVRGIREELGEVLDAEAAIRIGSERDLVITEEVDTSTSYPGLKSVYRLFTIDAQVQGLCREQTGMVFETGEECDVDGYCDKIHVWEWRKVEPESVEIEPSVEREQAAVRKW